MYSILFVDDEPLALRGLKARMRFEKLGIDTIYEALDADEARELFNSHHIDLLLCDIELPGDSGLDLVQWVNDNYPGTVTLFLTCHADFSYAQNAVKLMAFRYLLKPITPADLEKALTDAIKTKLCPVVVKDTESAVDRTIAYIRANLNRPLSREELGSQAFLNPNYLAKIFKERTNMTLFAFITKQRLEQAAYLLQTTDMRIQDICNAVGIDDGSHFTKLFKKAYSLTPKLYRAQFQEHASIPEEDE